MKKLKNKNTRQCRMCGIPLPPFERYDTEWCWMCWRETWECESHRYYVKNPNAPNEWITYWEEVQSLRGYHAFKEKNKPLIKKAMKEKKDQLAKEKIKENENN